MKVLMFRWFVGREIVWTVVFAGDGLLVQFIVCRFALLCGWVYMAAAFVEAGL